MESRLAQMEFSLSWKSHSVTHNDRCYFPQLNFWRDFFPEQMDLQLDRLLQEGQLNLEFPAGRLVPSFDQNKVFQVSKGRINFKQKALENIQISQGRFYPRGLFSDIGFPPQDFRPCRIAKVDSSELFIDTNHPLALYPLSLSAQIVEYLDEKHMRGGSSIDVGSVLTENGPGLQANHPEVITDFYSGDPFHRLDTQPDQRFYEHARLVDHVDQTASAHFSDIYDRFLKPGMKVLDLMSAWDSHINADSKDLDVTGLGLNVEELEKNPIVNEFIVQDLNDESGLPFEDESFDACICTVSVEYLVDPIAVFKQVGRVLKPGGPFMITFSDRWFDTKVIKLWTGLHPFERMALVTNYFAESGMFSNLNTESIRGYPRPEDDKHFPDRRDSDPVFAVWGFRS